MDFDSLNISERKIIVGIDFGTTYVLPAQEAAIAIPVSVPLLIVCPFPSPLPFLRPSHSPFRLLLMMGQVFRCSVGRDAETGPSYRHHLVAH